MQISKKSKLVVSAIFSVSLSALAGDHEALDKHDLILYMQQALAGEEIRPLKNFNTNQRCMGFINNLKTKVFEAPETGEKITLEKILAKTDTTGGIAQKARMAGITASGTLAGAGWAAFTASMKRAVDKRVLDAIQNIYGQNEKPKRNWTSPRKILSSLPKEQSRLNAIRNFDKKNPKITEELVSLLEKNTTWTGFREAISNSRNQKLLTERFTLFVNYTTLLEMDLDKLSGADRLLYFSMKKISAPKSSELATVIKTGNKARILSVAGGTVAGALLGVYYEVSTQSEIVDADKEYRLEQIFAPTDAGGIEPRFVCNKAFDGSPDGEKLKQELNMVVATMDQYFRKFEVKGELPIQPRPTLKGEK